MWTEIRVRKPGESHWREKLLTRIQTPVPQTDTGRWDEKSKARERTFVKELGKMDP